MNDVDTSSEEGDDRADQHKQDAGEDKVAPLGESISRIYAARNSAKGRNSDRCAVRC